jgi:hypothetical protein
VINDMGAGGNGPSPRVWKVYSRKKAQGIINDEVAKKA